jgi:DNA-binding MarR family transcriptional regulator
VETGFAEENPKLGASGLMQSDCITLLRIDISQALMPREAKSHWQLDVLSALESGEVVTQMSLSKRVGVAVGLINAVLRRSINKGYVKARQAPYKRYAYYLTPKGFSEKSRLVAEYLESSLHFFRKAREQYGAIFRTAKSAGLRLAVVGSGDLVEIAVLAAMAEDVELIAIIASGCERSTYFGVPVRSAFADIAVDAVVIADSTTPQATFEDYAALLPDECILAPALLRITRDRAALLQAAQ